MGKSAEVFATTVDVEAEAGVEVEVEGFRLRLEAGEVLWWAKEKVSASGPCVGVGCAAWVGQDGQR